MHAPREIQQAVYAIHQWDQEIEHALRHLIGGTMGDELRTLMVSADAARCKLMQEIHVYLLSVKSLAATRQVAMVRQLTHVNGKK
jgi:hypothetical protein